jgi:hypothetical protein
MFSDIETIEKDKNLHSEKNFKLRFHAIDFLEFHVIDRIDSLLGSKEVLDLLCFIKQYAIRVKCCLEDINAKIFWQLRTKISQEHNKSQLLISLIEEYLDYDLRSFFQQDIIGYDDLDLFLDGLLTSPDMPIVLKENEPGMVYYQKTPARIILELIKRAELRPHDVFFDLGSGLGQVAILVNLLTSVIAKGIEVEPAFCNFAKTCVANLDLDNVEFINKDARFVDYSSGAVFFMYTPFEGKMLQDVLQNLHGVAKKKRINIFTYGNCTLEVAKQDWLKNKSEIQNCSGEFCDFFSA